MWPQLLANKVAFLEGDYSTLKSHSIVLAYHAMYEM